MQQKSKNDGRLDQILVNIARRFSWGEFYQMWILEAGNWSRQGASQLTARPLLRMCGSNTWAYQLAQDNTMARLELLVGNIVETAGKCFPTEEQILKEGRAAVKCGLFCGNIAAANLKKLRRRWIPTSVAQFFGANDMQPQTLPQIASWVYDFMSGLCRPTFSVLPFDDQYTCVDGLQPEDTGWSPVGMGKMSYFLHGYFTFEPFKCERTVTPNKTTLGSRTALIRPSVLPPSGVMSVQQRPQSLWFTG